MPDTIPTLVCFDLGGVIIRICRSWTEGCHAASITPRHHDRWEDQCHAQWDALIEQYQTGAISGNDYFAGVSTLPDSPYEPHEVKRIHLSWMKGEYDGVLHLVKALNARGIITSALSNTSEDHWPLILQHDAVAAMRAPHASHLLGLHKPALDIYRAFEEAIGAAGPSIIFFDDNLPNVEAAHSMGWQAHHIDHLGDTAGQMIRHLCAHGIDVRDCVQHSSK